MRTVLLSTAGLLAAASACAESYPQISGEIETELQLDRNYRPPAGGKRTWDLFTNTELHTGLFFTPEISVQSTLHLEPVREAAGSRVFGDQGLYLEQLYLQYETDRFSLFAGKYVTTFGSAWQKLPALYGKHELAEDYEMTEKIGIGGSYRIELLELGTHELGASAFFQDSTGLSNSLLTRPGFGDLRTERPKRFRKGDPMVSNTRSLDSFVVSLGGDQIALLPSLGYHLSYIFERSNDPSLKDERGFSASLQYATKPFQGLTLSPYVEFVRFDNYQGEDATRTYLHAALTAHWRSWLGYAVYGRRWIDRPDGASPDARDRFLTLAGGYDLGHGLQVLIGWKDAREEALSSRTAGAMLTWAQPF